MPDENVASAEVIWAEMSYGGGSEIPEFVAFRIYQGDKRLTSNTLRRETAVELHRRINRIPEDAPQEISRCIVCNAAAEEAPPGLRKDDAGAWICINRKDCADRMWATGQTQASADEMHHRRHCGACKADEQDRPDYMTLMQWAARESAKYVVDRMGAHRDLPVGDGIQVVMTPAMQVNFRKWVDSFGGRLFQIPVSDDDLPTYGVTMKEGF
jgi:hypothetical protein